MEERACQCAHFRSQISGPVTLSKLGRPEILHKENKDEESPLTPSLPSSSPSSEREWCAALGLKCKPGFPR